MIFLDVRLLLVPVLFGNDKVYIADGFQELFALLVAEITFFLLLVPVKFVRRKGDNEIVSQSLGPLQQVDVSVVQQVEGPVCDDLFHSML